jgi:hypothetical protein
MNRLRMALLFIAGLLLSGCISYQPVDLDDVHWAVRAHDTVRITKQDGQQVNLTVTAITDEEIVGMEGEVALQQIDRLERKPRYDPGHVLVTIGVLITWFILA